MTKPFISLLVLLMVAMASFDVKASAMATKEQQQIDTLIQLKEQVELLLKTNKLRATQTYNCLFRYDLEKTKREDVAHDPGCYQTLVQLMDSAPKAFRMMRAHKALTSVPIAAFKSLGPWELISIPEESILAKSITYDVRFKDIHWTNPRQNWESPVSVAERETALRLFNNFFLNTCEQVPFDSRDATVRNAIADISEFCRLVVQRNVQRIQDAGNGLILMRKFETLLKQQYEFQFRAQQQSLFEQELERRPFLALVREPKTFKADLKIAFRYADRAADKAEEELLEKVDEMQINPRIHLFSSGKLPINQQASLLSDLKMFFEFKPLVQYFSLYSKLRYPEAFEELQAEHQKRELIKHSVAAAGILAAVAGCTFIPAAKTIKFSFLCSFAFFLPLQLYWTADSLGRSRMLHDLFFAGTTATTVFVYYKDLTHSQQDQFLNILLFTPLDLIAAAMAFRALPALSPQTLTQIRHALN